MIMKKSGYVTSYFANRRFHGGINHSITHTIRDYIHCAELYELDENLFASCFINNLAEPSPTFFLNNYRPGMKFLEIKNFMKTRFSSPFHQNLARNRLARLELHSIMSEEGIESQAKAVTMMKEFIEALIPQCPLEFQSDANKTIFLPEVVKLYPFAVLPFRSSTTMSLIGSNSTQNFSLFYR